MKFTCGTIGLGSARRDRDRGLATFGNVNTPSTDETDVGCIGSLRVWCAKQPFLCSFVPGVALANAVSSLELLQRSTRPLTPNSISGVVSKSAINESLLHTLGIFDVAKIQLLQGGNCIDRLWDRDRG